MNDTTVEITVTSHLNYDGYDCENRSFYRTEIAELKEQIAGREIIWIKGKNVFRGTPVSDEFFNSMVDRYYKEN